MKFSRVYAQPCTDTFQCRPIGKFVEKYLAQSKVSIDPFARNFGGATYTNDLNPDTSAQYHMNSVGFLKLLIEQGISADLVILDPPYSPTQIKRTYEDIGIKMGMEDAWGTQRTEEKRLVDQLLTIGGIVLFFGWNSVGMGKNRNYKTEELLLVCHGSCHNDTICMAQRKVGQQFSLW
jgi:hypothetical protein